MFKKGDPTQPKGNRGKGRKKGVPNRIRKGWKESVQDVLELNGPDIDAWLRRGARRDPLGAVNALTKLAEFTDPKLSRRELTGDPNGAPILIKQLVDDIPRPKTE